MKLPTNVTSGSGELGLYLPQITNYPMCEMTASVDVWGRAKAQRRLGTLAAVTETC
ncbi:hypothetical protein QM588_25410 [Rhodococcus sp. IEGM 1354]|uniref:hypothetical protein n=1 Tax=Rhodococcus sp. IEGM 1354 TaxID=3047088 RepID=UPI0024B6C5F3|nr:hypothetical protein [Rhodococcus sp. IEGM 1354]MDI9933766.1 hypothetical protein [Rhodococcus sp. IEGM 1354]